MKNNPISHIYFSLNSSSWISNLTSPITFWIVVPQQKPKCNSWIKENWGNFLTGIQAYKFELFYCLQTKNGSEPQYIPGEPYGVGRIKEWRRGNPNSLRTFKQQIGVTSTRKCGLRILWIPYFHHKDVYHIRRLLNCVLNLTNMEAIVESNFISSFWGGQLSFLRIWLGGSPPKLM